MNIEIFGGKILGKYFGTRLKNYWSRGSLHADNKIWWKSCSEKENCSPGKLKEKAGAKKVLKEENIERLCRNIVLENIWAVGYNSQQR